jgi:putative FmdB family regulatory protein
MPIYDLRCSDGHRFEVVQSFADPLPACPACGAATVKLPSSFGIAGAAGAVSRLPPPPEQMPQTWRGTYNGNREYVTSLRRTAEERQKLEERHPELAGDRRPIVAHEGRFENAPLRAGDPVPPAGPSAGQGHGHNHGHGHSHGTLSGHPHGHSHG